MANDPSRGFDTSASYNLAASIQRDRAEQERALIDAMEASRIAKHRREAERIANQRELVELQRKADEREAQRDVEQIARAGAEAKRKRNEIKRWIFTTSIAVAALTVAIIALVTR
jgi:hypothetical protein